MSFKDKKWKSVYRDGDQNLLTDFYKPALEEAVQYDRAVGFFSAEILHMNLQGIGNLIKNGGKMRLVIGHPLDIDEFIAVKRGLEIQKLHDNLLRMLEEMIEASIRNNNNRMELLAWLIATEKLEIKFAARRRGMYHEKIGIVYDSEENIIVFTGSANETPYALTNEYNAESISVYFSWKPESFQEYGNEYIYGFESLWSGQQKNTLVFDVPSEIYERIAEFVRNTQAPIEKYDNRQQEFYNKLFSPEAEINTPVIPKYLNGKEFRILDHQRQAVKQWAENSYKGILKLATGSGKTITCLWAATKIYEARQQKKLRTALIISVPYRALAEQWFENLKIFSIRPIKCWDSKNSWYRDLQSEVQAINLGDINFFAVVVVNRTLESDDFQHLITQINSDRIMFVGDECHNHGAEKINSKLIDAYYRMGLSATPFRSDDDEFDSPFPNIAKTRILNYYSNVVAEYTLSDAINDGVLCEYDYHIIPVYLTDDEYERYENISIEIGRLIATNNHLSGRKSQNSLLTIKCGERSRLLGAAENKFAELSKLLRDFPREKRKFSLVYCGEGRLDQISEESQRENERLINEISKILDAEGWRSSRFTSMESEKNRLNIMKDFKDGDVDALVAVKVLDEGVDVPICDKAFILASTKNPRQYIQRRGRVLRKADGKSKASIYDFIVLPTPDRNDSISRGLKRSELERIDDYCMLATNRHEIETIVKQLGMRDG